MCIFERVYEGRRKCRRQVVGPPRSLVGWNAERLMATGVDLDKTFEPGQLSRLSFSRFWFTPFSMWVHLSQICNSGWPRKRVGYVGLSSTVTVSFSVGLMEKMKRSKPGKEDAEFIFRFFGGVYSESFLMAMSPLRKNLLSGSRPNDTETCRRQFKNLHQNGRHPVLFRLKKKSSQTGRYFLKTSSSHSLIMNTFSISIFNKELGRVWVKVSYFDRIGHRHSWSD